MLGWAVRFTSRRWVVLGLALLAVAVIALVPWLSAALRTVFLFPYFLPAAPPSPLEALTPEPVRERVQFEALDSPIPASLYRPPDAGTHPALVVSLGLLPDYDSPLLDRFAEGLARDGFLVFIPRTPYLSQGKVDVREIEAFVEAFRYLQQHPHADPSRIGFAGFSLGASLMTLAAADPRIRDEVALVSFFGGYYDARDLIMAMTTQTLENDGQLEFWRPEESTVLHLRRLLIEGLPEEADRHLLGRALLEGEPVATAELASLSSEGRLVYDILTADDPAESRALLAQLPAAAQRELDALSPRSVVSELRTKVFILHDRADAVVPWVESRHLTRALPPGTLGRYTEIRLFEHVLPGENPWSATGEVAKLFAHLYAMVLFLG
ncbi:MAG: hypothetical protein HYZ68_04420 [Chloroflexi bacterium]|nr:hypothetical protein [Chloroflexota bacterium]